MQKRRMGTVVISAVCLAFVALCWFFISNSNRVQLVNQECEFAQEMILIKGGNFRMGAGAVYEDEGPERVVFVNDFLMSRYEVTNAEFTEFVQATGYITVAERVPEASDYPDIAPELLVPGSAVFVSLEETQTARSFLDWWQFTEGANWQAPFGPGSDINGKEYFPVVHIALEDARAYAKWKGHRLPTEAEFEFASRGGIEGAAYERGDTLTVNGRHYSNTWQGVFPFTDSGEDGHIGVAPVGCFAANDLGLNDLIGNVWEWTSTPYPSSDNSPGEEKRIGTIKGGSFLCSPGFCMRYRPAAKHAQETQSGTNHIGFRTVKEG